MDEVCAEMLKTLAIVGLSASHRMPLQSHVENRLQHVFVVSSNAGIALL